MDFGVLDARLAGALRAELNARAGERVDPLPRAQTVVLAGHRAAGKSTLLPLLAERLGRPAFDLDRELEASSGRRLGEWLAVDEPSFREAERARFARLPAGCLVAVGGGFLATHAAALRGCLVVLVPISFETYCERLRDDLSRPRLRPHLSLEEELRTVYLEREARHAQAQPSSLVELLLRADRGARATRVVTAPPSTDLMAVARLAKTGGAELLEVRTDVTDLGVDLGDVSEVLPLLVAERGAKPPQRWLEVAAMVDRPSGEASLWSRHFERPLTTSEACAAWRELPEGVQLKHVEPLGDLSTVGRLVETQAALIRRFGARVTVLATGAEATAFRAVLAEKNALDYLALDSRWSAASGQRRLDDAVRAARGGGSHAGRLGIIGGDVSGSRSPRIHQQPFDRLELPEQVDLGAFLSALAPHYRGLAVTNPFKRRAARAIGAALPAINTLVRHQGGWRGHNTDTAGARAVLEALEARELVVLGDGGVTDALRLAASSLGVTLHVCRHADAAAAPVSAPSVWTWPVEVEPPAGLRFEGRPVAVVAYGASAGRIARLINATGGKPCMLGPRWFIAQAREQRRLWESVT